MMAGDFHTRARPGIRTSLEGHAIAAHFTPLSQARTNRCTLQADDLAAMAGSMRLEGACSAMDLARYRRQVLGLRAFRSFPEVPADPYSIPVALARELIGYGSITLTAEQQGVYDAALNDADEHGPCCCHCWRWDAFAGQGRELIARRHLDAAQVAAVWDLEDGCGGPGG